MNVVINADSTSLPAGAKPITTHGHVYWNLLVCMGYDPLNLPAAAFISQMDHLKGEWVVLSPIHWQATHNDAMITAIAQDLQLNTAQETYWFNQYKHYVASDGYQLHYHDQYLWLLQNPNNRSLHAKPAYQLVNHSLMPELAKLDPSMFWQKMFTESQMFFASQPNDSLLNGVWAWGNAPLAEHQSFTICAEQSLMQAASLCSKDVVLYHPSLNLKKFHTLLITDTTILSAAHQDQLNSMSAHWYWNNNAYAMRASNGLTRLWRKLTHAD